MIYKYVSPKIRSRKLRALGTSRKMYNLFNADFSGIEARFVTMVMSGERMMLYKGRSMLHKCVQEHLITMLRRAGKKVLKVKHDTR